MNIFRELKKDLKISCGAICSDEDIWNNSSLEAPKDPLNGDIATNIAMIIASKEGGNPREIALKFKECLVDIPYIAHVEVAGPGFINLTIKAEKWHDCIHSILKKNDDFWAVNIGDNEKVNIEYVSANPTGPMHIGHSRGAVYGDVLANILIKCGYDVTKEYYINDAGSQIDTLIDSVILRYKECLTGQTIKIPEGLYPGEYLKPLAQSFVNKFGDSLLNIDKATMRQKVKDITVKAMIELIKSDLADLGVKHDVFFSEESLHKSDKINQAITELEKTGLIYTGVIPAPKGKIDESWQEKEQLLFRSSNYGDDQDRPVKKNDGSWSYLAADIAYAKDKIDRGFNRLIYVLGADHTGYVKRINAIIDIFGKSKVKSDVRTNQLVNFVKNGEQLKMSKRSGNFMTVHDVVKEVGTDVIRFIMLTRRSDVILDFDFDKVKEQSKDNPVFYVQYAHVRTKSILAKAKEIAEESFNLYDSGEYDLSLLATEEEIHLIKLLASWPKVLESSARYCEPQRIAYYLIDVASKFHSIWNLGKENNEYRFVVTEDQNLTAARLALADAIRAILAEGFAVIGVTPMDKM
jgi:arginyl-tRNA synthetase